MNLRALSRLGFLSLALSLGCDSETTTSSGGASSSTSGGGGEGGGGASEPTNGGGGVGGEGGAGGEGAAGAAGGAGAEGGGGAEPLVFLDTYPLDSTYPEGGAFDLETAAFYVGSLESGTVHVVDVETGDETVMFTETAPGTWLTLGMVVDDTNRKLWVCAADRDTDPFFGELWGFDLESGQRTDIVALESDGDFAWCEDVTVDSVGNVYATDRENPNIYRVELGASTATLFATDPELGSNFIGQNGIIVLPGDEAIIAAVHFPARLNKIDISSGEVTPIEIDGDFADATIGSGADGMIYVDGSLYVVFDGELVKVDPTLADWTAVVATEAELSGGLTDVMATPNGLYVVNGQAIGYVFGEDPAPFTIVKFTGTF